MKALSIHPYYALMIAQGWKTIECRTWQTNYRGKLLICSTAKKYRGTIPSHALCVVDLVDIVPFKKEHLYDAMMGSMSKYDCYAWKLENARYIKPVYVKGKLGLWNYDGEIEYIPEEEWLVPEDATDEEFEAADRAFIEKYWADITV